ncbi:hypothetical protein OESDEN_13613 [Oesophagostomum dentatum]|uniref:Uncharacterized protein n=1 Tax=Oesophagostomum dentatum TaxID=61180 RepID=A0A0B1SMW6_OESDE|nr:hypothetical protein OESDEN_13613 [Oesophagostomum dentatum]
MSFDVTISKRGTTQRIRSSEDLHFGLSTQGKKKKWPKMIIQ